MGFEITLFVDAVEQKVVLDLNTFAKEMDGLREKFVVAAKPLRDGGWKGYAAQAFFYVLDKNILPEFKVWASELTMLALLLSTALEEIKEADRQGKVKAAEIAAAISAVADFTNL